MSNLKIERICENNYSLFYRLHLWRKNGSEPNYVGISEVPIYLHNDTYFLYVAVNNDVSVGYVSATIIPKPDSRVGTMFIDDIWVAPKHRKRGFAKALFKEVEKASLDHKLWRLRLCVQIDNDKAIGLYKSRNMSCSTYNYFMEKDIKK